MKSNWVNLAVFILCCFLFLQTACQEQAGQTEAPVPSQVAPETAAIPADTQQAAVATEPAPAQAEQGKPVITFEKLVHDFGRIGPGTKNPCEFKFTNTGDGLLKIGKVRSTCGCTALDLSQKEYLPGSSGILKVKFTASSRRGPTTKHIFVHSNDEKSPKVGLAVKANVVLKVDVEPGQLNLSLRKENAGCPDITLTSTDGQVFSIKHIRSPGNFLTADFDPNSKAAKFTLKPKVDTEKLQKNLKGKIRFKITHPQTSSVEASYNVPAEFVSQPRTITILNAEPGEPIIKHIWIKSNYDQDFQIESTSSKKGSIELLSLESLGNRVKLELRITLPEHTSKLKFSSDVFYVNIKSPSIGSYQLGINSRCWYAKKGK